LQIARTLVETQIREESDPPNRSIARLDDHSRPICDDRLGVMAACRARKSAWSSASRSHRQLVGALLTGSALTAIARPGPSG
jgi:hypothetical protein